MPTLIALLHGPDQAGLVARVAGWIFERGGNILHADQHRDMEAGVFFQRVEWEPSFAKVSEGAALGQGAASAALLEAEREFTEFARSLGMNVRVQSSADRPRVALFVSKADHCFHDLVLRWKAGEFACEIVAVVGNHLELAEAARGYGLAFHHIPVTAATKTEAEARQVALLAELRADLVVLARYMQVLSADFLAKYPAPVINIHHSFLPAFAGGRPYHQAHARGVKLIGATAHYATRDLDEGQRDRAATLVLDWFEATGDRLASGRSMMRLGSLVYRGQLSDAPVGRYFRALAGPLRELVAPERVEVGELVRVTWPQEIVPGYPYVVSKVEIDGPAERIDLGQPTLPQQFPHEVRSLMAAFRVTKPGTVRVRATVWLAMPAYSKATRIRPTLSWSDSLEPAFSTGVFYSERFELETQVEVVAGR